MSAEFPVAAKMDDDGTVHLPAMSIPMSSYMSEEAKRALIESARFFQSLRPELSIPEMRQAYDEHYLRPKVELARARYRVAIHEERIGGVGVYIVMPEEGLAPRNRERALLNFHGGGFVFGSGLGQILEATPIAAEGRIKVISVDYRVAPEHQFPAASEDVARVYSELLREYQPQNIGFYGCSAGGELSAQAVAWLQREQLPRPGAIGIFGAGAYGSHDGLPTDPHVWGGDSRYLAGPLNGGLPWQPCSRWPYWQTDYVSKVSKDDLVSPLLAPALSQEVLKRFPPTLVLTGTRAEDLGAAVQTHRLLIKAGVDADLHLWDGLPHCFITDVNLPESQEAYQVITKFFDKHLGGAQALGMT